MAIRIMLQFREIIEDMMKTTKSKNDKFGNYSFS